MTENPVVTAVTHMLQADDETGRCLAIGELLDRLVRSTGLKQDRLAPPVAALLLLWRAEREASSLAQAQERAQEALRRGELSMDELVKLATAGRLLMGAALELQSEQLLAEADAEAEKYSPREDDLAVWLGKHVVKVVRVDVSEVHDGTGQIGEIVNVLIRTLGGQDIAVPPDKLTLYHREDENQPDPA
jgi:hypothetical protein